MSTQFTITVTSISPYTFIGPTFTADVRLNPTIGGSPFNNRTFTVINPTTAIVNINATVPPGFRNISLRMVSVNAMTGPGVYPPPNRTLMANYQCSFNSSPIRTSTVGTIARNNSSSGSNNSGGIIAVVLVACLHGSSQIQTKEGFKRMDEIQEGDLVLSGNQLNEYAKVERVAQCWLSFQGVDHDAIIIEKDTLGNNLRLIIDPGHPMSTKEEYLENGYDALRPAGTYWEELRGEQIYSKKWTDIFVQKEPSVRYDLILENPYNIYVANGVIVRSAGYRDHRYKDFV